MISMIEKIDRRYKPISTSRIEQPSLEVSQNTLNSCYIDDGYGDQSRTSVQRPSSQTRLKTVFTPDEGENGRRSNRTALQPTPVILTLQSVLITTTPQPVLVRVTNRNQPSQRQPMISHVNNASHRNTASFSSSSQKRTLLIGDTAFTGINYRGLKNDVKICARSGGSMKYMWDEISVYDMKSFAQIIICVGGNDCSSGMDTHVLRTIMINSLA